MTTERWDTHWNRIFDDARIDGATQAEAIALADRETTEQFGERLFHATGSLLPQSGDELPPTRRENAAVQGRLLPNPFARPGHSSAGPIGSCHERAGPQPGSRLRSTEAERLLRLQRRDSAVHAHDEVVPGTNYWIGKLQQTQRANDRPCRA